jgi:hypothetical protein
MAKCDQCGGEFFQAKGWQRFCRPKCRELWHYADQKARVAEFTDEQRELASDIVAGLRRA